MTTREDALSMGLKTYHGRPCAQCGSIEKYVSNYTCVACTSRQVKTRSKDITERYQKSAKGQQQRKQFNVSDTNRQIQNRYHRQKYQLNKDWYINRNLRKYNITLVEYNDMLDKQGGVCYICHQPSLTKMLAVDHNHSTGKVRKLLCNRCNTALGLLRENVDVIKNMINYIESHNYE